MMRNKVNTGETMTDKTISVNGKDFTITPDKSEVLDTLIKSYPNQTAFTRAEIKEALDGYLPYWIKSSRFPFKEPNPEGGVIFNLEQVVNGYNGGYSHGGETPVVVTPTVAPVAAKAVPSNMPVNKLLQNCVDKFPLPHANFAVMLNGVPVDLNATLADAGLTDGCQVDLVSLE